MLPRLILLFVFFALIILAVKKGFGPQEETIQRVPGYPEPIALKKFVPESDAQYLKNRPSAADYAYSFSPRAFEKEALPSAKKSKALVVRLRGKSAKRSVATKIRLMKH